MPVFQLFLCTWLRVFCCLFLYSTLCELLHGCLTVTDVFADRGHGAVFACGRQARLPGGNTHRTVPSAATSGATRGRLSSAPTAICCVAFIVSCMAKVFVIDIVDV